VWWRTRRDDLEEKLGYRFSDPERLGEALVHRSWAHEQGSIDHNERLEFLGDAVLGLVAASWLYARHPEQPEGELARCKAWLVAAPTLAREARRLELGERLRLGVGEERSGGREKASILADALEAVFGAIWLDGGPEAARRVIERYLEEADRAGEPTGGDPKTVLQEVVQGRGWPLPSYAIVDEAGPDHEKCFVCEVSLRGEPAGRGEGRTKKEAQQRAAAAALEALAAAEARSDGNVEAPDAPEAEDR
jgi:ribonuclease-3